MTDTETNPRDAVYDDEIDLRELFFTLWAGKWLISGISAVFAIVAIVVSLMMPNIYRAEALLAPAQTEGGGGLKALAAQYGGLASLAGINLGSDSGDKVSIGLEVLKSRQFIGEFIQRHDILVPLMAADGWDVESDQLTLDDDVYDARTAKWVRDVKALRKPEPSLLEAHEEFADRLSVSEDKKTGFIRVAFEFYSPVIASQWVTWLVHDLNDTMMRMDVAEAEQAIEFLNQQIENTSVTDLQDMFFRLIEEQMKTVMLAEVSNEYLLKTLDPAVAPEKKAKPKRSLIVILATLLGGFLGVVIQLVRAR